MKNLMEDQQSFHKSSQDWKEQSMAYMSTLHHEMLEQIQINLESNSSHFRVFV